MICLIEFLLWLKLTCQAYSVVVACSKQITSCVYPAGEEKARSSFWLGPGAKALLFTEGIEEMHGYEPTVRTHERCRANRGLRIFARA